MSNIINKNSSATNGPTRDFKEQMASAEAYFDKSLIKVENKLEAISSKFANTASKYMNSSRSYVRESPVKSVVIAATCGVVAGSLLSLLVNNRK